MSLTGTIEQGRIEVIKQVGGITIMIVKRRKGRAVGTNAPGQAVFCTLLSGRQQWATEAGKILWTVPGTWRYRTGEPDLIFGITVQSAVALEVHFDPTRFPAVAELPNHAFLDSTDGRRLIEALMRDLRYPDAASPFMIEASFRELLGAFLRSQESVERADVPKWLLAARKTLDQKFRHGISLNALAGEVKMHPAHLARTFKKHFGVSVGEYVRDRRLEWAFRKLGSTEAKLAEIAIAAGFADHAHFSRAFRTRYGLTPSECRLRLKSAQAS